ncbi:AAA family ATPase [Yinghuangia sp. ASG 101]|uniref:AAA family ATPase n=1 Tax=Yinghuangia sp. ASG 101 TaxID=2896848 RepID=UPI001E45ADAA|nr:AAA family ATPase [Yinghuangia sp. ASG 101]UGQ10957.1 AAA family ATPase [Yinghuangia sp. ASG 101]
MRSSDPSNHAPTTRTPRTAAHSIVLEGMPGAGKTTALQALGRRGHHTIGEYVTVDGTPLDHAAHPDHEPDAPHLVNWTLKATLYREPTFGGPVFIDRDWITALAWGHCFGRLPERIRWADTRLRNRTLQLPSRYVVFDLPPHESLHRRGNAVVPSHPWADPEVLARLREFYRDPVGTVTAHDRHLGADLARLPITHIDATRTPDQVHAELAAAVGVPL